MMEREFVAQKIKEYQIQEFIDGELGNVGHSHTIMKKTPLGEKIIVYASRPGMVVGRRGTNIKDLTKVLKKQFKLENPQIEINEVENVFLDADIVAEKITTSLERFGTNRFKGIGHKLMSKVMEAGARGIEVIMSGKIPGARARSWRFYQGYVKKCGDAAQQAVRHASHSALLKPGIVGVRVSIMPPHVRLPDDIRKREVVEQKEEAESAGNPQKKDKEIKTVAEVPPVVKSAEEKPKKKRAPRKKNVEVKQNENQGTQNAA